MAEKSPEFDVEAICKKFARARTIRTDRESRMDECLKYAMPGRGRFYDSRNIDDIDDVFDETAIVATQEFASRLQSGITPNFSRWADFKAGMTVEQQDREAVDTALDEVTEVVFEILGQSNMSQEVYESFLDLSVTLGCIEIDEGTAAEPIRFNSVPLNGLWVNNGPFDRIDQFYRKRMYTYNALMTKYPDAKPEPDLEKQMKDTGKPFPFLEATMRDWSSPETEVHHKHVIHEKTKKLLYGETYEGAGSCPIIAFRWSKAAGEVWGHGPLMNALPAIKTCNMVVQMVLENAQMSIAGMYNLDDDGVVNPDTIQLLPGTIIPRTPGSQGLSPITPGGDFNVANLVLEEMRANIKRALYNDMLGNPNRTPMSATEVAERMADLSRQIGAAFGRLQAEFVQPLLQRVLYILNRRGVLEVPKLDGRVAKIVAVSPLAQAQQMQDIQQVDRLVEFVGARFGPQLANVFLKGEEISGYVAKKLNIPSELVRNKTEMGQLIKALQQMQGANAQQGEMNGEATSEEGGTSIQ